MSAGPFEAMAEIGNLLSRMTNIDFDLEHCRQVEHLRSVGWNGDVSRFLTNSTIRLGNNELPLNDATEDVDGYSAAYLAARFALI